MRKVLFETVLPSKMFEALATTGPMVLGMEGAAAKLVNRAEAGLCIEPENEGNLVEALTKLAGDCSLAHVLCANEQPRLGLRYDLESLAGAYLELPGRVGAAS